MSQTPSSARPVAAVRETADDVRAVIVHRAPGRARMTEARTFPAADRAGLRAWLDGHTPAEVIRVAPARESLCRAAELPGMADPGTLAPALALLAEAELPAAAAHRRAGGLLTLPDGGNTGLLVGWTGEGREPLSAAPEFWTTPSAALAMLWRGRGVAVFAERSEEAVCVLVAAPARPGARVVLEQADTDAAWRRVVEEVVRETAAAAGANTPMTPGPGLTLDPASRGDVSAMVDGVSADEPWWQSYGLCLGAALAATDPDASVRGLAHLTTAAPIPRRSRVAVAADWLAHPRRAWGLAAAAVLAVALVPVGLAWARAKMLQSRVDAIEKLAGGRDELERKAALYAQLELARWPMTKLMGDVSQAAPVGVTVDTFRLAMGQGLTIHGSAKSAELVNEFQARLGKTKVFAEVSKSRVEAKGAGRLEFDLTAKVVQPNVPVSGAEDYASAGKTLAERLYGAGAKLPAATVKAPERGSRDRDRGGDDRGATSDRRPSTASDTVPAVMSDAEIAKMDFNAATRGWTSRKSYVQKNPALDSATKQRLQDEEQKMRDRAAAARGGT